VSKVKILVQLQNSEEWL